MGLGAPEMIMIIVAILFLFGGKKIPELMRGLGRGMKEFQEAKAPVTNRNPFDKNRDNSNDQFVKKILTKRPVRKFSNWPFNFMLSVKFY